MTQPDWNRWFERIPLGRWTDNGAVAWMPFHGQHIFIAGETDYGKSVTERVILKELKVGIRERAVEVIGIDAQRGVELQPAWDAGYLKEFYWGKDSGQKTEEWPDGKPYEVTFAEALEKHVAIMYERTDEMKKMGVNEWTITPDSPGRVILIDEAGQLFRPNIKKRIRDRVVGAIDTLTYQSRKCGYVVVACTQLANLEAIPIRHGLNFGIAHRMQNPLGYYQVTRNSMDMPPLPRSVPGLAYMSGRGKRVLRTQHVETLDRLYTPAPVEVVEARMPKFEYVPALGEHVDTVSGEVLEMDSYR